MRRIETELPGVWLLEPQVHSDPRGFLIETYHARRFAELGIPNEFVQDNHSRSVRGVLRGLHYQLDPPQAKLCRVVRGAVLDVVVDVRHGSPTFGRWVATLLSEENHRLLYVPAGFAHGFYVLSEVADFLYKLDGFYHPPGERGVAWDDPDLAIDWQLIGPPILSERDRRHPRLRDIPPHDLPVYDAP